ncbi:MAG: hypothetical protein K1X75_16880 [Leptospirales bacterium]|nr:hypothetical protein [Leptospirales bacterium]
MKSISAGLLLHGELDFALASSLLTHIGNLHPECVAQRCGNHEPLTIRVDWTNLESLRSIWRNTLYWSADDPWCDGSISPEIEGLACHSDFHLRVPDKPGVFDSLIKFMSKSASRLPVNFGFIHRLTAEEVSRAAAGGWAAQDLGIVGGKDPSIYISSIALQSYIPEIYLITIFGKPYIQLFGRKKLVQAPVAQAIELENGAIMLKLMDDLSIIDPVEMEARRREVKIHLGSEAFYDPQIGATGGYQKANFELQV